MDFGDIVDIPHLAERGKLVLQGINYIVNGIPTNHQGVDAIAIVKTRLAQLRAEKGRISQSELSRRTGITQKQLSALEAGKTKAITFDTVTKLCVFFSCTPNALLQIEEELPPKAEELAEADEIIAGGLGRAMQAPKRSADEIWAEFDAVRARIAANDMSEETLAAR